MRRLSIYRANAKVRNPARHLRALRKWADSAKGQYPSRTGDKYINWKIPVLDRLVEPPTTKPEWQAQALESLLIAARHFIEAKPEAEQGRSWVAVLVRYPNMWASEVTVFFDREYYESFLVGDESMAHRSLCREMALDLPPGMMEVGSIISCGEGNEPCDAPARSEEHWTIGETPSGDEA
jgi:hypothetical protein